MLRCRLRLTSFQLNVWLANGVVPLFRSRAVPYGTKLQWLCATQEPTRCRSSEVQNSSSTGFTAVAPHIACLGYLSIMYQSTFSRKTFGNGGKQLASCRRSVRARTAAPEKMGVRFHML